MAEPPRQPWGTEFRIATRRAYFLIPDVASPGLTRPSLGSFMQLNRVSIGIFDLNLAAAGPSLHLIPEADPSCLQGIDSRGQAVYIEDDAVPATRFLTPAVGHR